MSKTELDRVDDGLDKLLGHISQTQRSKVQKHVEYLEGEITNLRSRLQKANHEIQLLKDTLAALQG